MTSGRALFGARPAALLLVAGALALSVLSTAAPAATRSVGFSNVKLSASWSKSWLTASVTFTIALDAPARVEVLIRPVVPGPTVAAKVFALGAGATSETITFPARLRPGGYALEAPGAAPARFTIPTPPEGVVDTASVSRTEGGKAVTSVASPKVLWVRFHFLARPATRTVTVLWETPGFRYVGKVNKPYAATIDSDLSSNLTFGDGSYYAYLEIGGKITFAKEVHVT